MYRDKPGEALDHAAWTDRDLGEFSNPPAVAVYWRWTPTVWLRFFTLPVSSIEWDIGYRCSGCGDTLYECGPGGSSVPHDLRRRLLAKHGEARPVVEREMRTVRRT